MSYNIFLDDKRDPVRVIWMRINYSSFKWTIVRSYDDFVEIIQKNGLPNMISFDHDLAPEHYVPKELWSDYDASKQYQDHLESKEKNGYDCAKWLVDYCLERKLALPPYLVHSMNPVGKDNINGLLRFYSARNLR